MKLLKVKHRRGDQIIQTFWKIGSPQRLGLTFLICRNFRSLRKVLLNQSEALKSDEWKWIWVHKTFKIEIQTGGPNNSDFLQNWAAAEIRLALFNLYKFQDSEKSTPKSCRKLWNLMDEEEIVSIKLLKLKYRRGDQII